MAAEAASGKLSFVGIDVAGQTLAGESQIGPFGQCRGVSENIVRPDVLAPMALLTLQAQVTTLESKADAAIRNLRGMYDTLDANVTQTQQQIDDISWTLQQAEQASFGFLATEAPSLIVVTPQTKTSHA